MMDAHTARLMIAGGAVVFVGGCVALSRLGIPPGKGRVREPEPPAAYEFRGMNDDGTARVYHPEIGTFHCAVGDGPVVRDGSRFNDRGEFVLSDGEKARVAEAAAIRAQLAGGVDGLTDPLAHKPEWPPSVLVDSAGEPWRPSGGSAVLNRDQVAATFAKDPALAAPFGGDPDIYENTVAHISAVTSVPRKLFDPPPADALIPENYDKAKGRRHHVRPAPRSHVPWAVWNGRAHVRDYTRRYNALTAAYRLNATIGKD